MANRLSRRKISRYYADSLLAGADPKKLALNLAAYLVDSGRTKELRQIILDIEYQLSLSGVVVANVTSAHELNEHAKKAIETLVKESSDAKQIQLNEFIDPSLIGGAKIEFAGSKLDTTIAHKLTALKTKSKK